MTKIEDNAAWRAWVASRPPAVQKLANEFPIGTVISVPEPNGDVIKHWVIGYAAPDTLLISPVNPKTNYEESVRQRVRICAKHVREHGVKL